MARLERLRDGHADAVLAFEVSNREYFSRSISDRGDAYFEHFADGFADLLADQSAGRGAYYVLVDDGEVLGRFNLILGDPGVATLGYRVAERVAGRGVATATVGELCHIAAQRHGVRTLRAATSEGNVASQQVLLRNGFTVTCAAGPDDLGGKSGWWYRRDLAP
jgi:ribosomal-protein-alanine N-acetyltransferase